jgi:Flp pilus assembly protein TadD
VARSLAGDDAGAEQAWRSAERLAPRSAAASADLALAYVRQGRFDDATAAARRALDRDPDNDAARQVLESIQDADGT